MRLFLTRLSLTLLALTLAGCASRIVPDPRMPAAVRDAPVRLTVCYLEGEGAHLRVGDQVELANSRLGRLRIRHIPDPQRGGTAWNDGKQARVRASILTEADQSQRQRAGGRRFVPVGRFRVEVADQAGHGTRYDFLSNKVTDNLRIEGLPQCEASVGDDEIIIRGVDDDARHGGVAHLR